MADVVRKAVTAAARGLALLALGSAAACAVARIDVDVYKGPLANHQDVQVVQMAAMVDSSRPLVQQLSSNLEYAIIKRARKLCETDDFSGNVIPPAYERDFCDRLDTSVHQQKFGLVGRNTDLEIVATNFLAHRFSVERKENFRKSGTESKSYVKKFRNNAEKFLETVGQWMRVGNVLSLLGPAEECAGYEKDILALPWENFAENVAQGTLNFKDIYKRRFSSKIQEKYHIREGADDKVLPNSRLAATCTKIAIFARALTERNSHASPKQQPLQIIDSNKKWDIDRVYFKTLRDLTDTMVDMAHQILYVADRESALLEQENKPELALATGLTRQKIDQSTVILQEVGNAILNQADEIRQRMAHEANLKRWAGAEQSAVEFAYRQNPKQTERDLRLLIKAGADAEESSDLNFKASLAGLDGGIAVAGNQRKAADKSRLTAVENCRSARTAALLIGNSFTEPDFDKHCKIEPEKVPSETAITEATTKFNEIVTANSTAKEFGNRLTAMASGRVLKGSGDRAAVRRARSAIDRLPPNTPAAQIAEAIEAHMVGDLVAIQKHDDAQSKATKTVKQLTAERKSLLDSQNAIIAAALNEFNEVSVPVKAAIRDGNPETSNHSFYASAQIILQTKLRKEMENKAPGSINQSPKATCSSSIQILAAARNYACTLYLLQFYTPLGDPHFPRIATKNADGAPKWSMRETLDRVIAVLRQQHIKAISEFGKGSIQANHLEEALDTAYEHRSGMIYIRPSLAYLRTLPSQSIEQNSGPGSWRNEIDQSWRRSQPGGLSEYLVNSQHGSQGVLNQIENRFWQPVNSVRVSGAGSTNYAIAKDDVGNWYVKSFSSDPEQIITSMRNLALFNIGSKLNTDLLDRLPDGQNPTGDSANPAGPFATPLGKVFKKHQDRYDTATKTDFDTVKNAVAEAGLPAQIEQAWAKQASFQKKLHKSDDTYLSKLKPVNQSSATAALAAVRTALGTDGTDAEQKKRGGKVIDSLRAIATYNRNLAAAIAALDLAKSARDAVDGLSKKISEKETEQSNTATELAAAKAAQASLDKTVQDLAATLKADDEGQQKILADAQTRQTAAHEKVAALEKKKAEIDAAVTKLKADLKTATADRSTATEVVAQAKSIVGQHADAVVQDQLKRRVQTVSELDRASLFLIDAVVETKPTAAPSTSNATTPTTAAVPGT